MNDQRIIPEQYRVLSSGALKVIALVSMLIDHTAHYIFANLPAWRQVLWTYRGVAIDGYTILRAVGRLAFPIYCFLLVEGFTRTRSRKAYAIRLAVLALVSELPWNYAHTGTWRCGSRNTIYTLFLGFLALCVIEYFSIGAGSAEVSGRGSRRTAGGDAGRRAALRMTLALGAILVVSYFLHADYGCTGVGYIIVMYVLRERAVLRAAAGSTLLSSRWKAAFAFIPIAFYSGRRGFAGHRLKYAFYVIYPAHLVILYLLKKKMFGY